MTASGSQSRQAAAPSGTRIIERPRLIKLLDETDARVILLTAPAGYGKTTLARQWAKTLTAHVSISLSSRHFDVATLVDEIGGELGGEAAEAIDEHLRATSNPQTAPNKLGKVVSSQLRTSRIPWLILDDYHELESRSAGEAVLQLITEQCEWLRILIASRTRPWWVTNRHVVYGEVMEIGRDVLRMTDEESASLLSRVPAGRSLLTRTRGWPALVALASALRSPVNFAGSLPESLYLYLADELYAHAEPSVREDLVQLALIGDCREGVLKQQLGNRAAHVFSEARRLGFTTNEDSPELHPLIREFLLTKLLDDPDVQIRAREAINASLGAGRWENALDLILRFELTDMIEPALRRSFLPLSREGRLGTLEKFANAVSSAPRFPPPSVDVVLAEIALKNGKDQLARDLARRTVPRLGLDHPLASRAHAIVGLIDYWSGDFTSANTAFTSALETARDDRDEMEAIHGLALTSIYGELANASHSVSRLEARKNRSPVDFLRFVNAQLGFQRYGDPPEGLNVELPLDATRSAWAQADDPRARSSAAYTVAAILASRAEYAVAREWLEMLVDDAQRFDLEFVTPLANWLRGQIALGERRYAEAERAIHEIDVFADRSRQKHHLLNARTLRARLLLQSGDTEKALACVQNDPDVGLIPSWLGDYLATRALALAVIGDCHSALETAASAEAHSRAVDVRLFALAARAVARVGIDDEETRELVLTAERRCTWDPLVSALRSSAALAERCAADGELRPRIADLYQRTQDTGLARRAGIWVHPISDPSTALSRREQEVIELIALGYTNREIAQALVISDSTAKVHTRHIFEKLGVHSRSAAVATYKSTEPRQPT